MQSTPNPLGDQFYRAKRFLIINAGILFVTMFVGIKVDNDAPFIGFQLADPAALPHVFAAIAFYCQYHFIVCWANETSTAKRWPVNQMDFGVTILAGTLALLLYLWRFHVEQSAFGQFLGGQPSGAWLFFAGGVITAGFVVFLLDKNLRKFFSARLNVIARRRDRISAMLPGREWKLIFNPIAYGQTGGKSGSKKITFAESGEIIEGKNQNETNWRMNGDFLELLNDQSHVFSRFRYDEKHNKFDHTNDTDTLSIRGQVIVPWNASKKNG